MELDYILDAAEFLPETLRTREVYQQIIDILNTLISTRQPVFEEIQYAYNDATLRARNYAAMSYQGKVELIDELGFGYIVDFLNLNGDQLTQLLIFFDLIYILKGKEEGLRIVLDTVNMVYTYTTWDQMSPKGQPFTANLVIVGNEYESPQLFNQLRTFIRSYMLPWINITVDVTIQAPNLYIYPSAGFLMRYKDTRVFEAVRDVLDIALYDIGKGYDQGYYGASIYNGYEPVTPEERPEYTLTIIPTPTDATVEINNEITNTITARQGDIISWRVYKDPEIYRERYGTIVLNADKIMRVTLDVI